MSPDDPQTHRHAALGRPPDDSLERALAWGRLSAALFADAAPSEPPSLGEFQVLGVLGRGAMGTVYLAHDRALARDVAIKVLHARDAAARERLVREARALARVGHPALVAVHAIGEYAGQVHVVMERVRGELLRAWQARPGRPWREVFTAYLQVGLGLQALHDAGLIHRDIKPENVLVEANGRARIVDLGLAHGVDAGGGAVAGTPLYMAPEQRAGAAVTASDQFALCVALFEALYHLRPFAGATAVELAAAIAAGALVTPPAGEVPERVRGVLARGLQADPAHRWPSMRSLVDALEEAGATTRGQRDRQILLARTAAVWIDGVLERGLAGAVPLRPAIRIGGTAVTGQSPEDLSELLDRGRSLVLVGAPGAGKTMLLLGLARDAMRRAAADPTRPLPIVLQLASWSSEPLAEWAVDEVRDQLGIPRQCTRGWLRDDGLLLLLDGLDRVAARLRPACDSLRTPLLVDIAARTFHGRPAAELTGSGSAAMLKRELWSSYLRRTSEAEGEASAELASLAFIATRMEHERRSALYIEHLQPTWLEGRALRGLHAGLTLLVVVGAVAVLDGLLIGLAGSASVGLTTALLVGPTLALFIGLTVGVRTIHPVERLAWSGVELRRGAGRAVVRGVVLAVLVSAIATSAWSAGESSSFAVEVFVTNLVVYGLLFSLALVVVAGIRGEAVERRLAPNQGIRTSARNAAIIAVAVAGVIAIPLLGLTFLFGPPPAPPLHTPEALAATWLWRAHPSAFFVLIELCMAVTLGLFAGMHRGGLVVISHGVLRLLLALTGRLPLRLVQMLDRASARALLRKTGGGYIFIHDELREYLAGLHGSGTRGVTPVTRVLDEENASRGHGVEPAGCVPLAGPGLEVIGVEVQDDSDRLRLDPRHGVPRRLDQVHGAAGSTTPDRTSSGIGCDREVISGLTVIPFQKAPRSWFWGNMVKQSCTRASASVGAASGGAGVAIMRARTEVRPELLSGRCAEVGLVCP